MEIDFEPKVSCCLQNSSGLIDIENSFFAKYVDVFNLQTILLYFGLKNSKTVMKENIPVAVSVSVHTYVSLPALDQIIFCYSILTFLELVTLGFCKKK